MVPPGSQLTSYKNLEWSKFPGSMAPKWDFVKKDWELVVPFPQKLFPPPANFFGCY